MAENNFDVVIIGGGPGGYVGAIRAAQLGLKTCVVEKDPTLGGTCLNVGCIPSKALLDSSEHFSAAKHDLSIHGIKVSGVELDIKTMMARKDKIVKDLTSGIKFLFDKNKIRWANGFGKITSANTVEVTAPDKTKEILTTKYIVIATGSAPIELPFMKYDNKNIVSSTEALTFEKVPKHMVVIGGGAIGLEMGSVWMRMGAQVTVIEFADMIASTVDTQISKMLLRVLGKQGMKFELGSKVTGASIKKDGDITVNFEVLKDGSKKEIQCDKVLVAVGRRAYADKLGAESVGIETDERGRIRVNEHLQTKVSNIFAIGDVIRGPMLAHKAEEEGVCVSEFIANGYGHVNYETVPSIIYTWPEVASVGMTEDEVKEKGIEVNVGTFPFTPNGRAKAMASTDGLVKIIADKKSDRVLGVHILGPRASDMISEAVMAMEFGASSEDIARAFHAHPTLSEVMREAALNVHKLARQM